MPKSFARTFGQDLMRGEHVVGGGMNTRPGGSGNDAGRQFSEEYSGGDACAGRGQSGTSIFDPVLCELVYRWFSPPGGQVLDPFAGGSVRGIVAAYCGRRYTGIDLRAEQIAANREQWTAIAAAAPPPAPAPGGPRRVKVSAAMLRQTFHPCTPEFIEDTCQASCCQSSVAPSGIIVTIHPSEQAAIEARGGRVIDGLLLPKTGQKKCPFKTDRELCGLHGTGAKPFGCIASPFTLNPHNTLIVRNRYRALRCYKAPGAVPAYVAHRGSLDLIFGAAEAERIVAHLESGGGDLFAVMPEDCYQKLVDNDAIKHGRPLGDDGENARPDPVWITGDSRDLADLAPDLAADLIFSCPPYADLERYSDDPADISTMAYHEFRAAYFDIIAKAAALLKPDRFACFVVGEVRDKCGNYLNFVGDTVQAFREAGLEYYNEAILVTAVGSLPIRAGRQFASGRKIGKTHQNVLVFVKGDGKKAADACGMVEVDESLFKDDA